jgi:hypothetical protein
LVSIYVSKKNDPVLVCLVCYPTAQRT